MISSFVLMETIEMALSKMETALNNHYINGIEILNF